MNPVYPIYVISKGRWKSRLTSKALDKMNVPYHIVVEPQEYDSYAAVINSKKILVLPFSNLGQGSIPARNWVWEHSIRMGAKRHWILDDNIKRFQRFNNNIKYDVTSGTIFKVAEDFVDRYENVGLSGFQYSSFMAYNRQKHPFTLNTRIYSCILIDNSIAHRWRGKYNEDTDLSLRVIKDNQCTILFNAFLQDKSATMKMKGGNTEMYLNETDNRKEFAESLKEQHPDCVSVIWRFNRWHHSINYNVIPNPTLIRRPHTKMSAGVNEYGMVLS